MLKIRQNWGKIANYPPPMLNKDRHHCYQYSAAKGSPLIILTTGLDPFISFLIFKFKFIDFEKLNSNSNALILQKLNSNSKSIQPELQYFLRTNICKQASVRELKCTSYSFL